MYYDCVFRLSDSNLLDPSFVEFSMNEISSIGRMCFAVFVKLRLIKVERKSENTVKCNNLTLLNLMLILFGSCSEETLTIRLLALQVKHGVSVWVSLNRKSCKGVNLF